VTVHIQDNQQWTSLHYAASKGGSILIKLLLKHHAKIDSKSNINQTPLHLAVIRKNIACVKLLLNSGANIEMKTIRGEMAIDLADRESDIWNLLEGKKQDQEAIERGSKGNSTPVVDAMESDDERMRMPGTKLMESDYESGER